MNENFLHKKLEERKSSGAYRQLKLIEGKIDFCSNDYLGLASKVFPQKNKNNFGSTGSRLLAGNYKLIEEAEQEIALIHQAEAGLIFNSGYDANIGLLSSVPQKGDTIIYDYLCHASIRDGIRLSFADAFSFLHNDCSDLEKKMQSAKGQIFVITESVFSMDGDLAPLKEISQLCEKYAAALIVDEAHATGVIGESGKGLVNELALTDKVFARVHTFGKALGCHGAIVLGSITLKNYLVNFARSLIYTTSLPASSIEVVLLAYREMISMNPERTRLQQLVQLFQSTDIGFEKLISQTPIQAVIVPGNDQVKLIANRIQENGFDVRPILYPTVPLNKERLRIVLHSFNTEQQVRDLLKRLC